MPAHERNAGQEPRETDDDVEHENAEHDGDENVLPDVEHPADDEGQRGAVDERLESIVHGGCAKRGPATGPGLAKGGYGARVAAMPCGLGAMESAMSTQPPPMAWYTPISCR